MCFKFCSEDEIPGEYGKDIAKEVFAHIDEVCTLKGVSYVQRKKINRKDESPRRD